METLSDSPSPRHSPAPRSGDRIGSKLCLVGAEQFRTAAALRRFRTAIDAGCQFDIPNCPDAGRLLYLFKPRLDPLYHQKNKISARRRFKPDRIDPDKLIRHTPGTKDASPRREDQGESEHNRCATGAISSLAGRILFRTPWFVSALAQVAYLFK